MRGQEQTGHQQSQRLAKWATQVNRDLMLSVKMKTNTQGCFLTLCIVPAGARSTHPLISSSKLLGKGFLVRFVETALDRSAMVPPRCSVKQTTEPVGCCMCHYVLRRIIRKCNEVEKWPAGRECLTPPSPHTAEAPVNTSPDALGPILQKTPLPNPTSGL